MDLMIEDLMEQLVEGGSDLHIATGQLPWPLQRRAAASDGSASGRGGLQQADLLHAEQQPAQDAGADLELDCAYGLKGVARFRVNVYRQKGSYAACLRALGSKIPSVEMLNLPPVVLDTSELPRGLVLVTGPTGSAKPPPWRPCLITSTTPAANTSSRSRTRSTCVPKRQKPGASTPAERRHPQLRQCLARRSAGRPGRDPGR